MAKVAIVNLGEGIAGRVAPGAGEAVLWIHGYTLNSACWGGLWDQLPNWSHFGIDLPGHGNSLPLSHDEQLSTLANKITSLAIACRARHLVALSFGAIIALQMTLQHPDTFATLTIGSPILGGGPFDPRIWQAYREIQALHRSSGHGLELCDAWVAQDALFSGLDNSAIRDSIRGQVLRHPWWDLVDNSYARIWRTPQSLRELHEILVPTLLLVGGADCREVKQSADLLNRAIKDCASIEMSGLGHLCLLQEPMSVKIKIEEHWRKQAE